MLRNRDGKPQISSRWLGCQYDMGVVKQKKGSIMALQKLQDTLQGVSVLAVHKNSNENNLLRHILPDFGLRAEVVDDVEIGWDMYLKTRPHFMFIGIDKDDLDGLEFFKRIRERDPILPVIAIAQNLSHDEVLELVNLHVHYMLSGELSRKDIRKALISCTSFLQRREFAFVPIKDDLDYYPSQGCLHYQDKRISLTQKERHLLLLLLQNRGRIVYYEEIEFKVWIDTPMSLSALKSTVRNIHAKSPFKFITNYSKEGYGISDDL